LAAWPRSSTRRRELEEIKETVEKVSGEAAEDIAE
jgi:hypothetical protein